MSAENEEKWFETWFDSPYYHILYQNRNEDEAKLFIDHLMSALDPLDGQTFLDLACGKGRHAHYISEKGFETMGVDLSKNSIEFAKQFETNQLQFAVHDMREVIANKQFDFILNLFTSFGYFDDIADNLKMLSSIHEMLTDKGIFVLDFFNSYKVVSNMVESETKALSDIVFHLSKNLVHKKIVKSINFADKGKQYHFEEQVNVFSDKEILQMLDDKGFEVKHIFGDYHLMPFDKYTSDRFIVIASKK